MRNIEYLKGYWLESLKDVAKLPRQGLKQYLETSKHLFDYGSDLSSGDAVVQLFHYPDAIDCVIYDYLKFARVAFQSIEKIPSTTIDKNISWGIVKIYYSSFFAAHALMRLSGYYFSMVDQSIAYNINFNSPRRPKDIQSGLHLIKVDQSLRAITLKPLTGRKTTHQGLWEQFILYLNELDTFLLKEYGQGAQAFREQLENLLDILNKEGTGSFLTSFRNEINYVNQNTYWNSLQTVGVKVLNGFDGKKANWKIASERFDLSSHAHDELADFQKAAGFLVALAKEAFQELDRVSVMKKSFYKTLSANGYLGF